METRGGLLIRGVWNRQTNAIIYVKLGDADANTYRFEPMVTLMARWEKMKKDKHGKHCHEQRKHFSPFALSVDGMLGREALVVLANLSRLIAVKMNEPLSHVRGWINGRIAIAVARSYSLMIREARLLSPLRDREPEWDPASGLGLAQ